MQNYFRGVLFGFGILCVFLLWLFVVQAREWWNNLEVTDQDTLTAIKWNEMIAQIQNNAGASIPSGAVMSFYLTSCPAWWKPADGTDSTPDLRGVFVRWLNSFDDGATTREDGYQDPDGATRSLGDTQVDQFETHTHSVSHDAAKLRAGSMIACGDGCVRANQPATITPWNPNTGSYGSETRPNNVGLIYCVKQ